MKKYCVADNIDLVSILQEYESYYSIKFGRAPKITRKVQPLEMSNRKASLSKTGMACNGGVVVARGGDADKFENSLEPLPRIYRSSEQMCEKRVPAVMAIKQKIELESLGDEGVVGIVGHSVLASLRNQACVEMIEPQQQPLPEMETSLYEDRLLKPMPGFGNAEFRELASIISRDIFVKNPNVRWTDIAGLQGSKRLIKEAVVFPMRYPELFTGILSPWKGLLLYGPPGTGKTMLAKAIATECKTTFFNISASSIVSKWRGDSEKLVRVLFELARYHAPSTIFLDELEAIMSHRSSSGGEHEGSRRMKTELLIQMDGLAKTNDHVFLLAASNLPWELDIAMLRRLEKRILIGLPDLEARRAMFEQSLPADMLDGYGVLAIDPAGLDYSKLAQATRGYSGSDINLVCKEAAMRPLRRIFAALDGNDALDQIQDGKCATVSMRDPIYQQDVEMAISTTRPSCAFDIGNKYTSWADQFGSE